MQLNLPFQDGISRFVITYEVQVDKAASQEHGHGDHSLRFKKVEAVKKADNSRLTPQDTNKLLQERITALLDRADKETQPPVVKEREWKNHGLKRKKKREDLEIKEDHVPIVVFSEFDEKIEWNVFGDGQLKKITVTVTGDPVMHSGALSDLGVSPPSYEQLFDPSVATGTTPVLGPARKEAQFFSFYKYHIQLLESPWSSFDPCVICGTPVR